MSFNSSLSNAILVEGSLGILMLYFMYGLCGKNPRFEYNEMKVLRFFNQGFSGEVKLSLNLNEVKK